MLMVISTFLKIVILYSKIYRGIIGYGSNTVSEIKYIIGLLLDLILKPVPVSLN